MGTRPHQLLRDLIEAHPECLPTLRDLVGTTERVQITPEAISRLERRAMARLLLGNGVPRPLICARLMGAFEVSRQTADRDIGDALSEPPASRSFFASS